MYLTAVRCSDLAHFFGRGALFNSVHTEPVPGAARSKAWVCGRSQAEIVVSNQTSLNCGVYCGLSLALEVIKEIVGDHEGS